MGQNIEVWSRRVYYSDKQLAERYGVHKTTIWRWVKSREFPKPVKLTDNCTRWVGDTVHQWEETKLQ